MSGSRASPTSQALDGDATTETCLSTDLVHDNITAALGGQEIFGLDVFRQTRDDVSSTRVQQLMTAMNEDIPSDGIDFTYGAQSSQRLRFWKAEPTRAPVIIFAHGGSWRAGTYLDFIGSAKVSHFISQGYAFASMDYTLVPAATVERNRCRKSPTRLGTWSGRRSV